MNQRLVIGIGAAAAVGIAIVIAILTSMPVSSVVPPIQSSQTSAPVNNTSKIQIVAAENFWGSLVSQLGGDHAQVLSIVSDPNADPHEYESNAVDARALANANFIVINGAGYDDWSLKLIGANNNPNQKVLNVATLLGKKDGDNPHFWYNPAYVNETIHQMYTDLVSIDPANQAYYAEQYSKLNQSLVYDSQIAAIKQKFDGARVAATEDIFEYLSNATGLDLVSPPEFMQAVAEGNDPPAQSIVEFQKLLQNGNVTMLVYNEQTVTPLTESIKALATQKGIPIVGITETIQPVNLSFQDWMKGELSSIQDALNSRN